MAVNVVSTVTVIAVLAEYTFVLAFGGITGVVPSVV